jgi:hypothetical protein
LCQESESVRNTKEQFRRNGVHGAVNATAGVSTHPKFTEAKALWLPVGVLHEPARGEAGRQDKRNAGDVALCHGFAPRSEHRAVGTGPGASLVAARDHAVRMGAALCRMLKPHEALRTGS